MEDADSDSGFDSDGDWYHAGRDIVHGLRTNSNAVGPTEKEREAPGGDASLSSLKTEDYRDVYLNPLVRNSRSPKCMMPS